MLAGEGLGGVAQALLAIIGVDGSSKHLISSCCSSHVLTLVSFYLQSMALSSAALAWSTAVKHCGALL